MISSKPYRIIITGGGSGGHIYPAIAIARALEDREEVELLFVGAQGKMEMEKIPDAGYEIEGLWISGLQRKLSLGNLLLPFKIISSVMKCFRIIKKFKPDAVVGVGGFASAPMVYAATTRNIPTLLQEQNSYAGLANKWFAKKVQKVCVAHTNMERFFPKGKIVITGNPVRKDLRGIENKRQEASDRLGFSNNQNTLLVLGGSLGARTINEAMITSLPVFIEAGLQVYWQTGKIYFKEMKVRTNKMDLSKVRIVEFIEEMDLAYAMSDVIVSRAGALAISELCLVGKPVIFIPSPNVAEDHQTKNANALVKEEAAQMIPDNQAESSLSEEVIKLFRNGAHKEKLGNNILKLAKPNAADDIAGEVIKLIAGVKLADVHRAFFIGIGGIGMSAIARWFHKKGIAVSGYDRTETVLTEQLKAEGISVHYKDDPALIDEKVIADPQHSLVVYTPAIPEDHLEFNHLRHAGHQPYKRSEVLGMITSDLYTVAVAGTHGKTSTTSIISHIIHSSGRNCLAFVGGIMTNYESNLILPSDKNEIIVVVEADEFDRSFLRLNPDLAVVTAADADHLDIYGDADQLKQSFRDFIARISGQGKLFIKERVADELDLVQSPLRTQRYDIDQGEVRASNLRVLDETFYFDYNSPQGIIKDIALHFPGRHNVENALAAISVALELGISNESIKAAIASYKGVKRRFEYLIKTPDLTYIDDYAHHPEEIRSFLNALRELYPQRKITAIFQPHLFTRTRDFADGFAESLELADEIILLPIYPAREEPIEGVSSQMIAKKMINNQGQLKSTTEVMRFIDDHEVDVLATIGAGDIDKLVHPIKEKLISKYDVVDS